MNLPLELLKTNLKYHKEQVARLSKPAVKSMQIQDTLNQHIEYRQQLEDAIQKIFVKPKNNMKKEKLEEAGVAYSKTVSANHTSHMLGFINGAEWQAKRMYSEEDFKLFARQFYKEIKTDTSNLLWEELADKCLEQF